MFHPNVYADGGICLDILQNRWSPTYDVSAILTSIQSLLDEPNPNSPANSVAAQLYQVLSLDTIFSKLCFMFKYLSPRKTDASTRKGWPQLLSRVGSFFLRKVRGRRKGARVRLQSEVVELFMLRVYVTYAKSQEI